jgi:hypothetical protein
LSAIRPPHVKHLTGISISSAFFGEFKHYKNHYYVLELEYFPVPSTLPDNFLCCLKDN